MDRQTAGDALPNSLANEMRSAEVDIAAEERQSSAGKGNAASLEEPFLSPRSQVLRGRDEGFQERRMTYPAGRIYHLVPARLVFGKKYSYRNHHLYKKILDLFSNSQGAGLNA